MGFSYPHNRLSFQFPLIPQILIIFEMHDFKACQFSHSSYLWNRGGWYCHVCSHVTLVSVFHTFHIIIILSCFYSQNVSCFFLNITNIPYEVQTNSTTIRSDSVNISGWKVPLIFFQVLIPLYCGGISYYQCQKQQWSLSTLIQW